MRIAQVAPLYESVPPQLYGGTERVVSYLTERLVAVGHEVTLFASGDSMTTARLVPACARALRLNPDIVDPLPHHILMLDQVLRNSQDFDLVHFHTDYTHFPLSRIAHLNNVTTLHGRLDIVDLVPLYRRFHEVPLVSISQSQRKPLAWANWVGNVYHGLPIRLLQFSEKGGDYLVFLGRISPEKRPDRAIHIAVKAGRHLKIAAKVEKSDREYFEKEIKPLLNSPGVEFIGEVTETEKQELLGNALAYLFPIDWPEPFGLTMIEAMACGTPTIAFRCGSVSEIIEDGVSGFVVDDMESAVNAVERVAELDRRLCRKVFENRFTAARMTNDYLRVYDQLLGRDRSPDVLNEGRARSYSAS